MVRTALLCALVAACSSAPPPPPSNPATQAVPRPEAIHGPLAGEVPGATGDLVVHVRTERRDGATRVDGVYVTHGPVACGDLFEEHPGIRANVRGKPSAAGTVALSAAFHRTPSDSPEGDGWLALDPGELVPGGHVHGKLFLRAATATVAGEFTAAVCGDLPEFSASSDLAITIDGVTTHATLANVHVMMGHGTLEIVSTLNGSGDRRGSDAVGFQILDVAPTPDGKFFEGAPFVPSAMEVFSPAIPDGIEVRGEVRVTPFVLGEYAHVTGTITVPSGKAVHDKQHVVSVDGTFDAELDAGMFSIYAWLAAQHLPAGLPTVRVGQATTEVRAARVTTTKENGERIDLVELVDTEDPCAPNAHVASHFEMFESTAALGPPTYGPVDADVADRGGSINGWVAIATAPTVHGWVFAVDPPYDERVKPDRVEVAGHFDAKVCKTAGTAAPKR